MDYLLWGVEWAIVERMLIDAPSFKSAKPEEEPKEKKLTAQTAQDILRNL